VGSVGIVVNPWAGKDVRRLHAPVGHTPDTAKIGIVRRVASAALDMGAARVLVARDTARIGERAIAGLAGVELLDGPGTGSALDTRRAAAQFADLGCSVVVALGGDGTCRDVTIGWRHVPLIAVSTGTNNVFPEMIDATSAGTAAGAVASGAIDATATGRRAKVLDVVVTDADGSTTTDVALVDVALIDATHTGARAVVRADSIRAVVAAIASPASTGLSSIAGRLHPLNRYEPGAVVVRLGDGGRRVRVPIMPGHFDTLTVTGVAHVTDGDPVQLDGPGVLALDGERERVLGKGAKASITVRRDGPLVVAVHDVLVCAAHGDLFDHARAEAHDGS
jgi:predicted polyphosphate/ATP-dependent NAD kinase